MMNRNTSGSRCSSLIVQHSSFSHSCPPPLKRWATRKSWATRLRTGVAYVADQVVDRLSSADSLWSPRRRPVKGILARAPAAVSLLLEHYFAVIAVAQGQEAGGLV